MLSTLRPSYNYGFVVVTVLVLTVIIALGAIVWWSRQIEDGATACTQEAKLCSDGSYVSRTGPNCAFAECRSDSSAEAPAKTETLCEGVACPEKVFDGVNLETTDSEIKQRSLTPKKENLAVILSVQKESYAPRETVVLTAKVPLAYKDDILSLMINGGSNLILSEEQAVKASDGAFVSYTWKIPLPPSASPGERIFRVVAVINHTVVTSNDVTVKVVIDPSVAKLQQITISPKGSIMLYVGGPESSIFVNGYYTDGHNRNISSESSGTRYSTAIQNERFWMGDSLTGMFDITVKPSFVVLTGRKKGKAGLIIENDGVRYEREVEVFSGIDDPDLDR